MVWNTTKHEFRVHQGGSGVFVAKNSDATSWHKLLHLFGSFCTEFRKQPNGPKCTKMVRNSTKLEFRVQWGWSGVFVAKTADATSWHEHFATKAPDPPNWTLNSCFGVFHTMGCVRCEKFRRDIVARTFALVCPVLHQFCKETVPNGTKRNNTWV